ncbi:amino acid synthesis family protein [Gaiella sp.]|uniref:amino acid synthesis family protein n=1 Tax=Gaiella sp. TaxID=2663207 RepID=UPI0032645C46
MRTRVDRTATTETAVKCCQPVADRTPEPLLEHRPDLDGKVAVERRDRRFEHRAEDIAVGRLGSIEATGGEMQVRKVIVQREETRGAVGRELAMPTVKVVVAAVIANPLAGGFSQDLTQLEEIGAEVAALLVEEALRAAGDRAGEVSSYGKGAIVGLDGELEHAAALIHPRFGAPVRAAIGGGQAIIPSTKKVDGAGAAITMPLTNKDDIWSFDEMDAAEIAVPGAPRSDEILVCLALGVGGRPHARTKKPA